MTEPNKTPWHLWVVGVISLLWNGFGGFDFTMSVTRGEEYYRSMGATAAQIAQFNSLPDWMWGAWALGVYGAIIGSVLLLLRMKWAFHAFAASLVGAVVSLAYHAFLAGPGGPGPIFPAVIVVIAAFLLWYAWAMGKRGVLR
jgi:hypothetical protein